MKTISRAFRIEMRAAAITTTTVARRSVRRGRRIAVRWTRSFSVIAQTLPYPPDVSGLAAGGRSSSGRHRGALAAVEDARLLGGELGVRQLGAVVEAGQGLELRSAVLGRVAPDELAVRRIGIHPLLLRSSDRTHVEVDDRAQERHKDDECEPECLAEAADVVPAEDVHEGEAPDQAERQEDQ